jgi:hypothetical protein
MPAALEKVREFGFIAVTLFYRFPYKIRHDLGRVIVDASSSGSNFKVGSEV